MHANCLRGVVRLLPIQLLRSCESECHSTGQCAHVRRALIVGGVRPDSANLSGGRPLWLANLLKAPKSQLIHTSPVTARSATLSRDSPPDAARPRLKNSTLRRLTALTVSTLHSAHAHSAPPDRPGALWAAGTPGRWATAASQRARTGQRHTSEASQQPSGPAERVSQGVLAFTAWWWSGPRRHATRPQRPERMRLARDPHRAISSARSAA